MLLVDCIKMLGILLNFEFQENCLICISREFQRDISKRIAQIFSTTWDVLLEELCQQISCSSPDQSPILCCNIRTKTRMVALLNICWVLHFEKNCRIIFYHMGRPARGVVSADFLFISRSIHGLRKDTLGPPESPWQLPCVL